MGRNREGHWEDRGRDRLRAFAAHLLLSAPVLRIRANATNRWS